MASSSSIVIKVKYGEALRRFKASVFDNKLLVDIAMLKEKIRSFFSFGSGAEFTMTYVDEDDDVVIIADDDDLHDIVGQSLNPLRITVKLNNGNPAGSTETSAPVTLLQSQLPHHPFNSEVSQTMKLPIPASIVNMEFAAPETPKSPLLKPACWNPVVPKTPTSPLIQSQSQPLKPTVLKTPSWPLIQPQSQPLKPTVLKTPSWPLVQPQFLQFNPAVPKHPMSPTQPRFEPWTPVLFKTPMSKVIKPELQTRSPMESETLKSQLIKSQSQTLDTGATPMAPGVAELVEKMKTTGLNQFPASMTGISLPQLTGGTSNVTVHQDVNSESSTVKNTKVSVNSDIGKFNMMDKQPPKVTEDVKFKDVQPLRFVDYKFPDIQFQSVKAPSKASNGFKRSTVKNKETTDGVKDSKKVEVNHEVRSLFSFNDHWYARCNSCGIHPTAPWYKSKLKENYDLCCTCFAELQGSFADYIRMDKPTIANWKNFGETSVNSFMPPVVKNPEVANQDHLLDTVLPVKNIIKVSDSEGSNVDSPHKDQFR
ncbi:PB1 domain-containing protein [Tanacetum coccineum]